MIGILIAVLLAALVYFLCIALGLPAIVAIIAARARAARRHPDRRLRHRRPLRRREPALTADPATAALRAVVEDGRPGKAFVLADLKAAFKRFQADEMSDRAAALTYYSLMSLFPALLFAVAVLGVFGQEALITDAADYLQDAGAPEDTVDSVTSALDSAQSQKGTAITALVLGLALSLNSASGRVRRGRAGAQPRLARRGGPRVRRAARPTTSMWTLVVLALVIVTFVLVFLGGGLASDVLGLLGLGETAADDLADRALAGRARSRRCSSTPSSTTRRRTSRCAASSGSRPAPCSAC